MYLLDTNVLSELRSDKVKPSLAVRRWAASVPASQQFISAVSLAELEIGVLRLERRQPPEGQAIRRWFEQLKKAFQDRTLVIDGRVAHHFARLQVPDPMPVNDAWIASTARAHGLTVVTRNTKDFERRGVSMLNPWLTFDCDE